MAMKGCYRSQCLSQQRAPPSTTSTCAFRWPCPGLRLIKEPFQVGRQQTAKSVMATHRALLDSGQAMPSPAKHSQLPRTTQSPGRQHTTPATPLDLMWSFSFTLSHYAPSLPLLRLLLQTIPPQIPVPCLPLLSSLPSPSSNINTY
jgi:hypothetical protein